MEVESSHHISNIFLVSYQSDLFFFFLICNVVLLEGMDKHIMLFNLEDLLVLTNPILRQKVDDWWMILQNPGLQSMAISKLKFNNIQAWQLQYG